MNPPAQRLNHLEAAANYLLNPPLALNAKAVALHPPLPLPQPNIVGHLFLPSTLPSSTPPLPRLRFPRPYPNFPPSLPSALSLHWQVQDVLAVSVALVLDVWNIVVLNMQVRSMGIVRMGIVQPAWITKGVLACLLSSLITVPRQGRAVDLLNLLGPLLQLHPFFNLPLLPLVPVSSIRFSLAHPPWLFLLPHLNVLGVVH